jgi:LysM repeat protein
MLKIETLSKKIEELIMTILYLLSENGEKRKPIKKNMTFRLIFISLIFLWAFPLFAQTNAQNSLFKVPDNSEIELKLDSIEYQDSTMELFPADDLYKNLWNCTNIKYPKTEFARKNDTIVFTLVGTNDHPYFHPYHGKVISKFGPRHGRMHTGTDVKLHLGDSVFCAFDGKVRLAQKFSGYGNLVLVRHKNGIETLYAHLKSIKVKVNDTIRAGELVGLGGRTGRATTEHLHFETRIFGDPFDSNKYIDFENYCLRSNLIFYKNKQITIDVDKFKVEPIKAPAPLLAAKTDSTNLKNNSNVSSVPVDKNGEGYIQHIIRSGDNLWSIAKKYNTTVKSICEINKITVHQILKIGMILTIH